MNPVATNSMRCINYKFMEFVSSGTLEAAHNTSPAACPFLMHPKFVSCGIKIQKVILGRTNRLLSLIQHGPH
jgi:hypothetical protein